VIGTSGTGRYALSCGSALAERLRRVAVVSGTAPSDFPGVRQTWSNQDRRLSTTAAKALWILWAWMAKTAKLAILTTLMNGRRQRSWLDPLSWCGAQAICAYQRPSAAAAVSPSGTAAGR
jgi:hypothetical protein